MSHSIKRTRTEPIPAVNMFPVKSLSISLEDEIFGWLSMRDYVVAKLVCKIWNGALSPDRWMRKRMELGPVDRLTPENVAWLLKSPVTFPTLTALDLRYGEENISSDDIEDFADKLPSLRKFIGQEKTVETFLQVCPKLIDVGRLVDLSLTQRLLKYYPQIESITLAPWKAVVEAQEAQKWLSFPQLRNLSLKGFDMTEEAHFLSPMEKHSHLKTVELYLMSVSQAACVKLFCPPAIVSLKLREVKIVQGPHDKESWAEPLSRNSSLEQLSLWEMAISLEDFKMLCKIPHLKTLELNSISTVEDACQGDLWITALNTATQLESLTITCCNEETQFSFSPEIQNLRLPNLESLSITFELSDAVSNHWPSPQAVRKLLENSPHLHTLIWYVILETPGGDNIPDNLLELQNELIESHPHLTFDLHDDW